MGYMVIGSLHTTAILLFLFHKIITSAIVHRVIVTECRKMKGFGLVCFPVAYSLYEVL
jgi:hypothetical protein